MNEKTVLDKTGLIRLWTHIKVALNQMLTQAKESGEFKGDPGESVTVANVSESTADGGENVVTFSDGKTQTIKNGNTGAQGERGINWRGDWDAATIYRNCDAVGYNGKSYVLTIEDGEVFPDGEVPTDYPEYWTLLADKGDSPVRGTDYWTEEDKAEIKSYVDEAILGGAW